MTQNRKSCSAEIGSLTEAFKARDALSACAIPSNIIKLPSNSRRGCVYCISYSCVQENNVRTVLASAKISVRHFNTN